MLLVEDEEPTRVLVSEALEQAGYDVNAFANGTDALRFLAEHAPDLVVTDWRMEGLNGAHVYAAARELRIEVPVIVIAGHAADVRVNTDPRDSRLHVLEKPFSMADLIRLAATVLPGD